MKKQFSFSVTADSMAAKFMECLGHKRGAVLEAIIARHLAENGGYLAQEVAAEAGYRFTEKDRVFAAEYGKDGFGGDYLGAVRGLPLGGREDSSSLPLVASLGMTDDSAVGMTGDSVVEMIDDSADGMTGERVGMMEKKVEAGDGPVVKNREMVLAGLSAFLG